MPDEENTKFYHVAPGDPTELTTNALNAAKDDLRREMCEAERLRGIEHITLRELVFAAIEARKQSQDALHTELSINDRRIEEIMAERFDAVAQRFAERDTRTEQAAQESRISLDAALAAAKEAVGEQNKSNNQSISKSEAATTKLIDGLQVLMATNTAATNDKISDLRTRLDRGEASAGGARDRVIEHRATVGQQIAIAAMIAAPLSAVAAALILKK